MVPLFFFVVSTFFILAFTFAINNYYDIDTDKENPRRAHLNAMASGKISKQTGMLLNIIFIIIPLVLSLFFTRRGFCVLCVLNFLDVGVFRSSPTIERASGIGYPVAFHCISRFGTLGFLSCRQRLHDKYFSRGIFRYFWLFCAN